MTSAAGFIQYDHEAMTAIGFRAIYAGFRSMNDDGTDKTPRYIQSEAATMENNIGAVECALSPSPPSPPVCSNSLRPFRLPAHHAVACDAMRCVRACPQCDASQIMTTFKNPAS